LNPTKNKYLPLSLWILCITLFVVFLSFDANAVEEIPKGRKIWDNIMIWVNFGILVFLFLKFGKKPLMNFLFGERNKIKDMLHQVDDSVKKARALMDAEYEKVKDIDRQLESIKEEIIALGKIEKETIIGSAKTTAAQMIEDAKRQSEYRLITAKEKFSAEMLEMAVSIAVEKLKKEVSPEDNDRFIDQFTSLLSTSKAHFS
jgi:F-type H+-transporting ATPase subunit b